MYSKAIFVASTLLAFVAATPAQRRADGDCTTGSVQCCNTVEDKDHLSPDAIKALGLVNVAVKDIGAAVGLNCNPITGIGAGGAGCATAPVCCTNSFQGLVAVGCVPVNVGL